MYNKCLARFGKWLTGAAGAYFLKKMNLSLSRNGQPMYTNGQLKEEINRQLPGLPFPI
jgi:hypothetical protein